MQDPHVHNPPLPEGRPVRVLSHDIHLFTCPACKKNIEGTGYVEVYVGEVTDIDRDGIAEVATYTRLRGLSVEHECTTRGE